MPGTSDTRVAIGVSACLVGARTRSDGRVLDETVALDPGVFTVTPVCSEVAAGSPAPRPPVRLTGSVAEMVEGTVRAIDTEGLDVTAALVQGAGACLARPGGAGVRAVALKEGSPSCGLFGTRRVTAARWVQVCSERWRGGRGAHHPFRGDDGSGEAARVPGATFRSRERLALVPG